MARISGVDIPREKRLEISLTYIFGVGRTLAQQVCDQAEMSRDTRVRDLTEEEVAKLRTYIDQNLKVEGDLRREIAQNIKRKMEIGCYEGLRHRRGLPVRGQRTRTNARTRKGPKKTVAGKKRARK
jgi:small subunit ribosomal protein S13